MIMNIISRNAFTLLDVVQVSGYELNLNSDYDGKSTFVVVKKPIADEDDFIIFRDNGIVFCGIIGTIENEYGSESYTITAI